MCKRPNLFLTLWAICFNLGIATSAQDLTKNGITKIDYATQHYIDEGRLSGAAVMVTKKGEVIYKKAFGMQNIEEGRKMNMNSLFRVASMTKPVTIVAALQLVEEGKLSLEDPAYKFLKLLKDIKVMSEDGSQQPLKTPITIKHLMMHTAGFSPYDSRHKSDFRDREFESLEAYIGEAIKLPLISQPGEQFNYNICTTVLGRILEIIEGKRLDEILQVRVFGPLKMSDTGYFVPESKLDRLASIYTEKNGKLELVEGPINETGKYPQGGNGLITTANDYVRFATMLLNKGKLEGVRILRSESVELMTTDQLPREIFPLALGKAVFHENGFGLGVAVVSGNEKWKPKPLAFSNLGNLPQGSYYWPGVTNTYWWVDPVNEIVGVNFSQSADPGKNGNFQEFFQALYQELALEKMKRTGSQ